LTRFRLLRHKVRYAPRLSQAIALKESEDLGVAMFLHVSGNSSGDNFVRNRLRIATARSLITRRRSRTQLDDIGAEPFAFEGEPALKLRPAPGIRPNRKRTAGSVQTVEQARSDIGSASEVRGFARKIDDVGAVNQRRESLVGAFRFDLGPTRQRRRGRKERTGNERGDRDEQKRQPRTEPHQALRCGWATSGLVE
jgi:hypothetical protein